MIINILAAIGSIALIFSFLLFLFVLSFDEPPKTNKFGEQDYKD